MAEPPGGGGPFLDNYDLTKAKISQQHIAARLSQGPRDENGRFRITKGMSSLVTPEEIAARVRRHPQVAPTPGARWVATR